MVWSPGPRAGCPQVTNPALSPGSRQVCQQVANPADGLPCAEASGEQIAWRGVLVLAWCCTVLAVSSLRPGDQPAQRRHRSDALYRLVRLAVKKKVPFLLGTKRMRQDGGCVKHGCVLKHTPPRAHKEMALESVSGADFWCKLMSGGRPVDLRGSRGRFPG